MEPILELAVRITGQIWYLHGLFPDVASIDELLSRDWQKALHIDSFAALRDLLDLTEIPAPERGYWTAEEWLWPYEDPAIEERGWERYRLEWKEITRIKNDWDALQQEKERALNWLWDRVTALRAHLTTKEGGREPDESPLVNREELYEEVVRRLLHLAVSERVALADKFIPADGFFIEDELTKSALAVQESDARRRMDLPGRMGEPGRQEERTRQDAREWAAMGRDQRRALLLHPTRFRDLCARFSVPVPFSVVLRDELDEIARSRLRRLHGVDDPPGQDDSQNRQRAGIAEPHVTPKKQAFASNLFGMALSGGGIRSATFALGVLEGMADRNILPYIDILSTVSGGGYIGSWLISWIKRKGGIRTVQESMQGNATQTCPATGGREQTPRPEPFAQVKSNANPEIDARRPLRLLRSYGRYLAPQAGLFALDTWTISATWFRNTLLNLTILSSLLGALLLLPRIVAYLLIRRFFIDSNEVDLTFDGFALSLCAVCVWVGWRNLLHMGPSLTATKGAGTMARGQSGAAISRSVLPLVSLAVLFEVAYFWNAQPAGVSSWEVFRLCGGTMFIGCMILASFSVGHSWKQSKIATPNWLWLSLQDNGVFLLSAVMCGVIGGGLTTGVYFVLNQFGKDTEHGVWLAASFGIAMALAAIGLTAGLFIGLMGDRLSDEHREWWSRMGAMLGIAISAWLLVCGICFFAPVGIARLGVLAGGFGGLWGLVTWLGTKLAFDPKSGKGDNDPRDLKSRIVLALAPAVFVLGLLALASFGDFLLVVFGVTLQPDWRYAPVAQELWKAEEAFSALWVGDHYWTLMYGGSAIPLMLALLLAGICVFMAWRVDINLFSMHHFYRNRLVRCYLGASRERRHRAPNAFTAFDLEDDIRLTRFQEADGSQPADMALDCRPHFGGPYPILNTALNVTQGQDLGLQERQAESFIFTPLWSGFDFSRPQIAVKQRMLSEFGFRRTDEFGQPHNLGASLGTAMAISGAAFNSNMGFHTSPTLAFLLTVFGVRLGWWAGNPRLRKQWTRPSPVLGLKPLVSELIADTTTDSDFVLLSDGGHFENMGLYELVRRQCRYLIVVDAEEDEKFKLEGIGGAIRKCRVDFGAAIDLDLEALKPLGDPAMSKLHYSIGTVRYRGEKECAKLIYIKSSVTGDEPVDVVEFRKRHVEFPHTSTTNQFFDESHFESYRALGQHVAAGIFMRDADPLPIKGLVLNDRNELKKRLDELFRSVESIWTTRLDMLKETSANDEK